tara:strand:- start:722 stop:1291 length:570 start_codon:yes stop_codon:yes gene_type:complete
MLIIITVILVSIFIIFSWYLSTYNDLVSSENFIDHAFSGIDVQLTKRYDLIPNLVSVVKNYMVHERETLTEITALRSKAVSGKLSSDEKIALDNKISGALGQISIAVENYPNLQASSNFLHLQATLNEVEAQLSASRRSFNSAVTSYNNKVEMFPSSIVASRMGLKERQWFKAPEMKRGVVNVGALFNN